MSHYRPKYVLANDISINSGSTRIQKHVNFTLSQVVLLADIFISGAGSMSDGELWDMAKTESGSSPTIVA